MVRDVWVVYVVWGEEHRPMFVGIAKSHQSMVEMMNSLNTQCKAYHLVVDYALSYAKAMEIAIDKANLTGDKYGQGQLPISSQSLCQNFVPKIRYES